MRPVNTFLADSRASLERAGRRQQQFSTGSFYSLQSTLSSDTDTELWSVQGDTAEAAEAEESNLARTRSLQVSFAAKTAMATMRSTYWQKKGPTCWSKDTANSSNGGQLGRRSMPAS